MVFVSLIPARGNATRLFPHTGYLGLSTVRIDGSLRTIIHPDDRTPLAACAISVAVVCSEYRLNKIGAVSRDAVLAHKEVVLWHSASPDEPELVGEWDLPFRIELPTDFGGISTVSHQEYKVTWRLDANIYHPHTPGIGTCTRKSYPLGLIRYDVPVSLPPPPQRLVQVPSRPIGPDEVFSARLVLPAPPPNMVFSGVTAVVERVLDLPEVSPPNSPEASRLSLISNIFSRPSSSGSGASAPAASGRQSPPRRSPSPARPATSSGIPSGRSVSHTVLVIELPLDPYSPEQKIQISLPKPPSSGHWSLGETTQTEACHSRFYLRTRIHCIPAAYLNGSAPVIGAQSEHLDMPAAELLVTIPTGEQRREAIAKASRSASPPPQYVPVPSYATLPTPPPTANGQSRRTSVIAVRPVLRRPRTAGSSSTKPPIDRPLMQKRLSQEQLAVRPRHRPPTPPLRTPTQASPSSIAPSSSSLRTPTIEYNFEPSSPASPKRTVPPTASDPSERPRKGARLFLNLPSGRTGNHSRSPSRLPDLSPSSNVVPGVAEMMPPEHILAWEAEVERINSGASKQRIIGIPFVGAAR